MNSSPNVITPPKCQVTTEQKIAIRTLRDQKYTHQAIATALGLSRWQVQHTCSLKDVTPLPRCGRPRALSSTQIDELEAYVTSSPENRRKPYMDLALGWFRHWGASERVIRCALLQRGYKRHIARSKPRLTEQRKLQRKEWALAHINWTKE